MFDIGLSELIVCAIVGLIVIGPERLPEAVRTIGLWVGRLKRSLRETREELERQIGMEDVRRQLHTEEMMRTLADMQEEIDAALNYERMGKNKPVIEHSNNATPALEGHSIRVNSEVLNSESLQTNANAIDSEPDINSVSDLKIPPIKAIGKSEPVITHH